MLQFNKPLHQIHFITISEICNLIANYILHIGCLIKNHFTSHCLTTPHYLPFIITNICSLRTIIIHDWFRLPIRTIIFLCYITNELHASRTKHTFSLAKVVSCLNASDTTQHTGCALLRYIYERSKEEFSKNNTSSCRGGWLNGFMWKICLAWATHTTQKNTDQTHRKRK